MWLCRNLILVISHLFAPFFLIKKNLSSFGFYKSHIKTFSFGMWAIFLQDGPRSPASMSQLLVRKYLHILLRTDSCIFLLFSRNVGTHVLYDNLFRNSSLFSSFLAFPHPATIPKTISHGNPDKINVKFHQNCETTGKILKISCVRCHLVKFDIRFLGLP